MNDDFDAESCAEAIQQEIAWQIAEWEKERKEAMEG